jgi:hypothetical protein
VPMEGLLRVGSTALLFLCSDGSQSGSRSGQTSGTTPGSELESGERSLLQDDGIGFSVACQNTKPISATSSGLGILGMRERCRQLGEELTIRSTVGKGTLIQVTVPASAKRSGWLWQKPWPF